jgi:hypothetical protein
VKTLRKAPGLAKKKAFYWKKEKEKREGERYGSIYAILLILLTVGTYLYKSNRLVSVFM